MSIGMLWTETPSFLQGQYLPTREANKNDFTRDRWLSVDELAAHLGVKRYTIYKWIERKNIAAHKVGILLKFKRNVIDE